MPHVNHQKRRNTILVITILDNRRFWYQFLKTDDGTYVFRYDPLYLVDNTMPEISVTLPKTCAEYRSDHLFPFFFGLLAEGYQKKRQCRELHIDENDDFTRLLETSAYGAIGFIYVKA